MPLWKFKPGVGPHFDRTLSRNLVAGEIVQRTESQIGSATDKFEKQDGVEPAAPLASGLKIANIGGGKFNVINVTTGLKINDNPLSREAAETLVGPPSEKTEGISVTNTGPTATKNP